MQQLYMELPPAVAEWPRLSEGIAAFCESRRLAEPLRLDLQLVCEEWFVNIVNHGYLEGWLDRANAAPITVELSLEEDGELVVRFTDAARAFNPLEHRTPDVSLPADERPIGGLGIYLIKLKMDACSYAREGGRNHFTMRVKTKGEAKGV